MAMGSSLRRSTVMSIRRFPSRFIPILALAALVVACGVATRPAYEAADVTLLVTADRYLDLEGEQWKLARGAIQRFHAWHRRAELPRYELLLGSAAVRVDRGLGRADLDWALANLRARYAAAVDAAVQQGAALLHGLSARNIASLEHRFAADDRKRARALSGDAAKRDRARVDAIAKRIEEWTGPLSAEQLEPIQRFVQTTSSHPQRVHEHRQRKQRELLALLEPLREDGAGPQPNAEALRSLFLRWETERQIAERDYETRFIQLVLDLDRALTTRQRTHAVAQLRRYAEDCRRLSQRT